METFFLEITLVICIAAVFGIIFKIFKQPPILAYILTGILLGPFGQLQLPSQGALQTMAQLGITLLLFMMGLEFKLRELKVLGPTIIVTGALQIITTFFLGFLIAFGFHFSFLTSFYIAAAVTFSSTIIVVKMLADRKELQSLFGRITVGVLLIQDLFAIFTLMMLSGFSKEQIAPAAFVSFLPVIIKGILLSALVIFLGKTIIPKITTRLADSMEVLLLFSLAWVFGFSALVSSSFIGFPIEIGGFLAGLALSTSSENFQIAARVRALRDFFITIFFVFLGIGMSFAGLSTIILPALVLSAFVLVGKPLLIMGIMGLMGYRKKTSYTVGIYLAQVSEFSLGIIFLGFQLKHLDASAVALVTLIAMITFTLSTYVIASGNRIYAYIHFYLGLFERKHTKFAAFDWQGPLDDLDNHVVLIGAHRTGQSILASLRQAGEKVVVVDFDPEIIKRANEKGVVSIYGDISDHDIREKVKIEKAKLVISTVPDIDDNLMLLSIVEHQSKRKAKIVVLGQTADDAGVLYASGADYVIVPHLLSGRHLANIIGKKDLANIHEVKAQDLQYFHFFDS